MLEKSDLEVRKEGLLKLFYHFHKDGKTMEQAFEAAIGKVESEGYSCRYRSFDGFRNNVLCAKKTYR